MPKHELEKNLKIETRSNPILNCRTFCWKMMHFDQILINFFFKPVNWAKFFQQKKNRTQRIVEFWNPKNSNPNPKAVTRLKPKEIQTQSSSIFHLFSKRPNVLLLLNWSYVMTSIVQCLKTFDLKSSSLHHHGLWCEMKVKDTHRRPHQSWRSPFNLVGRGLYHITILHNGRSHT